MSKPLTSGAKDVGVDMDYEQARELVYGMSYDDWETKHQEDATPKQLATFNALNKDQFTE